MLERSNRSVATQARRSRWPWLVVVLVAGGLKVEAYSGVVRHPGGLIVLLALGLGVSLLRPRPLAIAAMAAALFALVLAPHPLMLGVGVGVGVFVVLMVLFFALATVLHARQGRQSRS